MLINRATIILKAQQPAVDWINSCEVDGKTKPVTLAEVNEDGSVYLVSEDVDCIDEARAWAILNAETLIMEFCDGWWADEKVWPKDIGPELLIEWFDLEYHSMIIDTCDAPIVKEEL